MRFTIKQNVPKPPAILGKDLKHESDGVFKVMDGTGGDNWRMIVTKGKVFFVEDTQLTAFDSDAQTAWGKSHFVRTNETITITIGE